MIINPLINDNVEKLAFEITNSETNVFFIFGDKLQGKTYLLNCIEKEIGLQHVYKINNTLKNNFIEYCYATALNEIIEQSGLVKIFRSNKSNLIFKKSVRGFFRLFQAKKILGQRKVDTLINYLLTFYDGQDEFTLKFALYDVIRKNDKIFFLVDDFEKNISKKVISEIIKLKNDELKINFIFCLKPDLKIQNYFKRIELDLKVKFQYVFLRPLKINTKGLSMPVIKGITTEDTDDSEIYLKTINNFYYGNISPINISNEIDFIIISLIITYGGITDRDLLEISRELNKENIVTNTSHIWKIGAEYRFVDLWREYTYVKFYESNIRSSINLYLNSLLLNQLLREGRNNVFNNSNHQILDYPIFSELSLNIDIFLNLLNKVYTKKDKINRLIMNKLFVVIEQLKPEISISIFNTLSILFNETQNLFILDFGLDLMNSNVNFSSSGRESFLNLSVNNYKKWHDITLKDKIYTQLKTKNTKIYKTHLRNMKEKILPFIIHGHDQVLLLQLKDFLQNNLNTDEPIILNQRPNLGYTVIEKFEKNAADIDVAFALFTEDDVVKNSTEDVNFRARQNVIYELGYFTGYLGRGKTILIVKGNVEIPSDLSGVVYLKTNSDIMEIGEKIRIELENMFD